MTTMLLYSNVFSQKNEMTMLISGLIEKVKNEPESIEFTEVIACIEANYNYTPARFTNGSVENAAGTNAGSCKIFAFAQLNNLSQDETLALFGAFYRNDVLLHPEEDDHANIRNFMQLSWAGITFDFPALIEK